MKNLLTSIIRKLELRNFSFDSITFVAGDASNRKYFRLIIKNHPFILMYDDTFEKGIDLFLKTTKIFRKSGVRVPNIYENFLSDGILIIEDFGEKKFSLILNSNNEDKLYREAVKTLIFLHKKERILGLKYFSKTIFLDEVSIFFDWYLKLVKKDISTSQKQYFFGIFSFLLNIPMKLPKVNIHRDYHVDNIFFLKEKTETENCGWIDYQDALYGTCVYDLLSLLEDARRPVSENIKNDLINYYLDNYNNIDRTHFKKSFKIIAIQRHLKVLGIFARLHLRDKKSNYLKHLPLVIKLLRSNLESFELKSIKNFIIPLIS